MILASASPRRLEIFNNHGFYPVVIPSDIEENIPLELTPAETVMFLSLQKGLSVKNALSKRGPIDMELIVAADTIVVCDGQILGKPAHEAEAAAMIEMLSGRSHQVLTGVTLLPTGRDDPSSYAPLCFYEESEVFFREISPDEIAAYVATDEPYDKAGAYAVQGTFSKYTRRVDGSLENVIGFPFERFLSELKK